jgi:hypothetical protein
MYKGYNIEQCRKTNLCAKQKWTNKLIFKKKLMPKKPPISPTPPKEWNEHPKNVCIWRLHAYWSRMKKKLKSTKITFKHLKNLSILRVKGKKNHRRRYSNMSNIYEIQEQRKAKSMKRIHSNNQIERNIRSMSNYK